MNAPALCLQDFPTHGVRSVKTDRSLAPFNERGEKKKRKKKKSPQATDVQPETTHCSPSTHPPHNRETAASSSPSDETRVCNYFTPGSPSFILFRGNFTLHWPEEKKKIQNLFLPTTLRGKYNSLTNDWIFMKKLLDSSLTTPFSCLAQGSSTFFSPGTLR